MKYLITCFGIVLTVVLIIQPVCFAGSSSGSQKMATENQSVKTKIRGKTFSQWVDGGSNIRGKMDRGYFRMKGVDSERNSEGMGAKYNMGSKDLNVKSMDSRKETDGYKPISPLSMDSGKISVQKLDEDAIAIQDRMDSQEATNGYEPIDPFSLDEDKLQMTH